MACRAQQGISQAYFAVYSGIFDFHIVAGPRMRGNGNHDFLRIHHSFTNLNPVYLLPVVGDERLRHAERLPAPES